MRAIIAILPLAGLLCWLNPTPADSASALTAGFKSPSGLIEARNDGRREAATLVSTLESAVESLTHNNTAYPGNRPGQPASTLLVDSAVVR
jgi:hypothetical protein